MLTAAPTGTGLARVSVLLAVIWWMYGGYVWLTNALDLDRTRPRLLLLAGMAAYFVMSLAVPRYFEDGPFGLVLGVAYLVVVVVHTAGFLGTSGRGAIMRLGPLNLLGALILVVAGLLPPGARLWLALAVVVLHYATPHIVGIGGFVVGAGHFVERHGLALIILLGESIIAVGTAATAKGDVTTVVIARCSRSWSARPCGGCTSTVRTRRGRRRWTPCHRSGAAWPPCSPSATRTW